MRFRASLQFRVTVAFAALGAVLSLMLSLGIYLASIDLERRLVDETLTAELEDYTARRGRNPHSPPPATTVIRGYVSTPADPAALPPELDGLQPGRYWLEVNGTPYRVAVADSKQTRFYLLHNQSPVEKRHRGALMLLCSGVILTTLIAAALGHWLTFRVISPVRQLAGGVMALRPERAHKPLAADYPPDEVGELALAFDRYVERIRGFVERERAFTADLSHELRTPLTVISGATEVLLADPSLASRVRVRVERIQRAAEEMAEMIPALLALARETEQGASPPRASLGQVLTEVVDSHAHLLEGKAVDVELEIGQDEQLRVEPALLRSALGNLIRNAFTYTEEGRIRLQLNARSLLVEDTGPGIPTAEIERVFRRYYVAGESQGSGIGLSLVKRICERYGWSIRLRSTPTIGTVIQMEFGATA